MKNAILLCLILLLNGCASSAAPTNETRNPPLIPSSIITNEWTYKYNGIDEEVRGEWVHISADEAANLLLYIDSCK